MPETLSDLLRAAWAFAREGNKLYLAGTFACAVLIVLFFDIRRRRSVRRYFSRPVLTDAIYNLVYVSGAYTLLIWGPVYALLQQAVRTWVPFLEVGLLSTLPAPVHYTLYILVTDFVAYWQHRWMHSNRFLWTLHGIHHSQTTMTILAARRFHVLDSLIDNLIWFTPAIVMGIPTHVSIGVAVVHQLYSYLQHSDTDWGWGPFERVFISPRYHSVHHSTDPNDYDRNFGAMFAIWDHLFGTAVHTTSRPIEYGAPGLGVPEGFFAQLLFPVRKVAAELRSARRPLISTAANG
jgi:sterol desaturase/sphingolipid hydroxylase (fatty acid hydroxylase superfamily)